MTTRRLLLLVIAAALWVPPCARAQQAARLPMVGVLVPGGAAPCGSGAPGFVAACMVQELRALGYVEGRNIAFEYRYANDDYKRLPTLATELVALRPDVVYTHTTAGAEAAAKATSTIPIVVGPAGETGMSKLAGNLARPAGNVTGQSLGGANERAQKSLQLLKELAPRTSRVAVILNPDNPTVASTEGVLALAATQLGVTLVRTEAHNAFDLPQALAAIAASGADAVFMDDDSALAGSSEIRKQVSEWASGRRLPVASSNERFAADGALVSIGTDIRAIARRAAFYVHRILGGAKPADLPIELPTTFKLSVNRKTATALGLTLPPSVLLRADEVIE